MFFLERKDGIWPGLGIDFDSILGYYLGLEGGQNMPSSSATQLTSDFFDALFLRSLPARPERYDMIQIWRRMEDHLRHVASNKYFVFVSDVYAARERLLRAGHINAQTIARYVHPGRTLKSNDARPFMEVQLEPTAIHDWQRLNERMLHPSAFGLSS